MARQPPTMQASRIRGRRMLSTAAFAHRFFLFYTIWAGDATCVCDIAGLTGHHIEFYRARGSAGRVRKGSVPAEGCKILLNPCKKTLTDGRHCDTL